MCCFIHHLTVSGCGGNIFKFYVLRIVSISTAPFVTLCVLKKLIRMEQIE